MKASNPRISTIRESLKHLKSPIIVDVAGDSGSGKNTLSNGIRRHAKGYRVNLILEPTPTPLPSLSMPLVLAAMLELDKPAFLLAVVPFRYWGRTAIAVHIDGNLAPQTI